MTLEDSIRQALQTVKYPGYSRDIVSFGLIKEIKAAHGSATVLVQLTSGTAELARQVKLEAEQAIRRVPGIENIFVEVKAPAAAAAASNPNPWASQNSVPGIRRIIAVASGKGGVGKSTASANLACALQHLGRRVGLLDCDIYGPSIPLMMGVRERPAVSEREKLVPPSNHGVKLMSMGFLLEGDAPVIWRGPMIVKTIQQFVSAVEWGDLDYLLVDLPPGTGDAQLTLCQTVPLTGGVIVTTPQEASLGVVRKGIAMFQKVNVPILGIIENMSCFTTPAGERFDIFGHGGGRSMAGQLGMPFLGEIPIFPEIRAGGDAGTPVVVSQPDGKPGQAFLAVARQILQGVEKQES